MSKLSGKQDDKMQNSELYRRRGGKHKSLVTNETEESMEKL
jgi:hypothetical protein